MTAPRILHEGFAGVIGNTPLVHLRRIESGTGCTLLAKAEFMNPGGSVKDRAALAIIRDAERRGDLHPGGTVVEGTAGNTGIGLAHLCNALGYRCVIFIPANQSREKIDLLRTLGAEVRPVPAVPYNNPDNYVHQSRRYAASLANAVWANQFDNPANREGHYTTTGPEIWRQTEGNLDAFTCAVGTGGTLAGVSLYLKEKNPAIRCVLADPSGSALLSYIKQGEPQPTGPASITEGIGNSRVTANLAGAPIDDAIRIEDTEVVHTVYRLLREEGLFVGSSSGVNVAAALTLAHELGPGHTIVTLLCDGGGRYYSRLYNPDWLREKGLSTS